MDSAKIRELDARYLASVLKVRFFPLVIERADGCRITDADGVTRLDFTAGWAVANLGYNNPRVRQAVADPIRADVLRHSHGDDERAERSARRAARGARSW